MVKATMKNRSWMHMEVVYKGVCTVDTRTITAMISMCLLNVPHTKLYEGHGTMPPYF